MSPASRWPGCYRAAPGLVPSTYVWWGSNARCHHQAGPSFRLLDAGGGGHASGESAWAPAGFYRRLLVGKSAQKVRVAVPRSFTRAVFWMLTTGRSYRKMGPCLAPEGRRTRDPTTWRTAKAGLVTLQPASHAGHIVLGQGRKVPLGGARRKASGGPGGDGRAALREP
jgi:hypothetical protein